MSGGESKSTKLNLLLIGANGKLGKRLVAQSVANANWTVSAFVRSKSKLAEVVDESTLAK